MRIRPAETPGRAPRSPRGNRRRYRTKGRTGRRRGIPSSRLDRVMADLLHALAGIAGLLGLAFLAGEDRRAVPWRAVAVGVALQVLLAFVFLKVAFFREAFLKVNDALIVLEQATQAGTSLVFGYLGGGKAPFEVTDASSSFILAFRALPIVLVMSALSAVLFYWRVLPSIVRALS